MKNKFTEDNLNIILNSNRQGNNSENRDMEIELIKEAQTLLSTWDFHKKSISIEDNFFVSGRGYVGVCNEMAGKDFFPKENNRENETNKKDFQGVYVYLNNRKPYYVGISRSCIKRTFQHIRTKNHYTSTLAYKICKYIYEDIEPKTKYKGGRKDFFELIDRNNQNKSDVIFNFLKTSNIAYFHIADDDLLALFEILFSVKYNIFLNTFRTH